MSGGTTARRGLILKMQRRGRDALIFHLFAHDAHVRAEDSDGGSCVRGYLHVTISWPCPKVSEVAWIWDLPSHIQPPWNAQITWMEVANELDLLSAVP